MAVPGRRNEEYEEDENALFEENSLEIDLETDIPLHLRELSHAALLGEPNVLRLALVQKNRALVIEGGDVDTTSGIDEPLEDGDTALHSACLYGYLPCVQLLLERGANLEAKDEDGAVPLHDACAGGFIEIVQLLLDRAANNGCLERMLDTVDAEGDTPLHHAARGEHAEVIRSLLANGASPTKANTYGKIPQELADPESEAFRVFGEAANGW